MKQSSRMMWKMAGILMGLLVLFLLIYREARQGAEAPGKNDNENREETVKELKNVWVKSAQNGEVTYFLDGKDYTVYGDCGGLEEGEQVADLVLRGERLEQIHVKKEKMTGKLLRRTKEQIEIEGQGSFEVADEFRGYRLYGGLKPIAIDELPVGSSYIDYVVENGKICAALLAREEKMESIRVLIQSGSYEGIYHDKIVLCGEGAYYIELENGTKAQELAAGERVELTADSGIFSESSRIRIYPYALTDRLWVESISRSQGTPAYRGSLEIVKDEAGLYLINEVLLEEYLYAVVPSEMPSRYPLEALKAQSICARTYAYRNILQSGCAAYGAHVDDSTAYQVYHNIAEQERTTQAVRETSGQVLRVGDSLAGTYYYSTSCGYGTDAGIWKGTEEFSYLEARHIAENAGESGAEKAASPQEMAAEEVFAVQMEKKGDYDYEREEPWYRWSYTVKELDAEVLERRLRERKAAAPEQILVQEKEGETGEEIGEIEMEMEVKELGDIQDIRVHKRRAGGVIDELIIEGSKQTVKVISEYNVRYVLCNGTDTALRQDGSRAEAAVLLPSAFFTIEVERKTEDGKVGECVVGYRLAGGGYGHGVGMSQNGAARMADCGMKAEEILTFFYKDGRLVNLYETGGSRE